MHYKTVVQDDLSLGPFPLLSSVPFFAFFPLHVILQ